MPTLTATVLPAVAAVRLDIDFSDIDSPYVYVTRLNQVTGVSSPVRLHGFATTVGGLAYTNLYAGYKQVLYDLEAPLDTPVTYTATSVLSTMNVNTDFESGSVLPWVANSAGAASLFTISATTGMVGSYAASVIGDGATATPGAWGELVPATPGATWTFSVLTIATSISVTIGIRWINATGGLISTTSTSATINPSPLTTMTVSGTAPALTAFAQPVYQLAGTPSGTDQGLFDSAVLSVAAATVTTASVTVASLSQAYLKDPQNPANNVIVTFCFDPQPGCTPQEGIFWQEMDPAEVWNANSAAFEINNQPDAAVVSKQRQDPSSTLSLVTRQFPDRDRLLALLSPGTPLFFQVTSEYGVPDRYMAVGNVSVGRVLPDHRFPIRIISLPFVSAVAPGGTMAGVLGARWRDGCNKFTTWSAVTAASITWTQALQGALG